MASRTQDFMAQQAKGAAEFASGGPRRQINPNELMRRRAALKSRAMPERTETPPVRNMGDRRMGAISRAMSRPQPIMRQSAPQAIPVGSTSQQVASPIEAPRPVAQPRTITPQVAPQREVMNTSDALVAGATATNANRAAPRELPKMSARQINLPKLTNTRRG